MRVNGKVQQNDTRSFCEWAKQQLRPAKSILEERRCRAAQTSRRSADVAHTFA
jgi:hypothetical protein